MQRLSRQKNSFR